MVDMHLLMERLFPICRSLSGDGNRETLAILSETVRNIRIHEVPTGTSAYDWTVPKEWNCRGGYIEGPDGTRVVDFADSNLQVMGYSTPVDARMGLAELQPHLYSLPEHPDWIPYVTSYYRERWGFCLPDRVRRSLPEGRYHVVIDSELKDGSMSYGEAVLPGESEEEVIFSTYVCHPSMANNELSGPCLAAALYDWLAALPTRRYTYRFVFAPETLGALVYLSRNLDRLRKSLVAGFILTCVGDDGRFSYMPSRRGDTLADRVALRVLEDRHPDFVRYSFLERGSDERQYCAPGVDLPFCSVMRTKYGAYPQYHTSADDLDLVTPGSLEESFETYCDIVRLLERNRRYRATVLGEPQLGRRGLYPTLSTRGSAMGEVRTMMNLLAYADGTKDLIDIAGTIGVAVKDLFPVVDRLTGVGLICEA